MNDASGADTGAAFGQDDSEFNIFNTDRQLSALQTAAKMLGWLNEKKVAGLFRERADGCTAWTTRRSCTRPIDAAIRRGVVLADGRARAGGEAPLGDATQGSQGGIGDVLGHSGDGGDDASSSSRRTRCIRWPPIPAARRCSTTTT